jgi:hypothetical protein
MQVINRILAPNYFQPVCTHKYREHPDASTPGRAVAICESCACQFQHLLPHRWRDIVRYISWPPKVSLGTKISVAPPKDGKARSTGKTRFPARVRRKVAKITRFRYRIHMRSTCREITDRQDEPVSVFSHLCIRTSGDGYTVPVRQRHARVGTEGPHRTVPRRAALAEKFQELCPMRTTRSLRDNLGVNNLGSANREAARGQSHRECAIE